ncbi:PAQR family membrane homeostasis protein TrhA [Erysipelothrix tonsillarum]|uniref:PAQR family membrane homeostasis protein TrhA n=1 Tax=Erysipelothrix tonsillarum TaxID=38402 RepID=UPI000376CF18|nr:hemolysin III family protein [Erysipelothrix tonsillarum]
MTNENSMKHMVKLSFKEEVLNCVSHGIMALALLFSLPYVAIRAYHDGGALLATGESVFVISLFFMFLGSTLYHSMEYGSKHKYIFRFLDHSFIFVAIAGSYTPIALYAIGGTFGIIIVLVQWAMVLLGILYKALAKNAKPSITVGIYLVMGWTAVVLIPRLLQNTSVLFLGLIVLGGILYSIGAWFYMQKDKPYYHFIWHLFINFASIAHFIAIVFCMA